ncbi:tape measure domain protein [Serratia plymuthica A30]|uniref:tape measure protein n=1 Tax=Serratia plymuthica TaxID=82996 RepID=UPI0002A30C47|nr:tape measure protein [Serratia plymuthica]EKF64144.1 tape measure domain protein [Serratia plymuthica A30]
MAGNVIVTRTTNVVDFQTDNNSYSKAKKKIQSLKKEWEKVGNGYGKAKSKSRPKGDAAEALIIRQQAKAKAKAIRDQAAAEKAAQRQQNRELLKQQRIIDKMNARQARFAPVYNNTKGAMNYTQRAKARADFAKINQEYAKGVIGAQTYTAKLGELQKQMRATAKQGRQVMPSAVVGGGLNPVAGAIGAGLGAYGVLGAGQSLMKTGVDFQGIHSILKMTEDDADGAAQSMRYLMDLSGRLGVDLVDLADQYAKMNLSRGNLSKQTVQDVVTGMQEYGTALHLDKNRMSLANFGLQQVFGKGKVSAQELNLQIAESMPGAKQAFLKAWQSATGNVNLTQGMFDKDMAAGLITTEKIMPHLGKAFADMARKGDALNFAVKGINASYNRMINQWNLFKNKIFESKFGDALTRSFELASSAMEDMSSAGGHLGELLGGMMDGFIDVGLIIYDTFVFANRNIEAFLKKWGMDSKQISELFNMAGWGVGAALFAGSLMRITGLLRGLIKLVPGIKSLGGALSAAGLVSAVTGKAGLGGVNNKETPTGKDKAGLGGKILKGAAVVGGGLAVSQYGSEGAKTGGMIGAVVGGIPGAIVGAVGGDLSGRLPSTDAERDALFAKIKANNDRPTLGDDFRNWVSQFAPMLGYSSPLPTVQPSFTPPNLDSLMMRDYKPTVVTLDQKGVEIKVAVDVNDGQIDNLVTARVAEQSAKDLNLIVGTMD